MGALVAAAWCCPDSAGFREELPCRAGNVSLREQEQDRQLEIHVSLVLRR